MYSFSLSFQLRNCQFALYIFFLLGGVGTYFFFPFDIQSEDLVSAWTCFFFANIITMAFFRISLFAISFMSLSSWFSSLLGLSIVYGTYNRQQFTKPTSQLLIFLKTLNTRWCFYLLHCIYWCNCRHLNFCQIYATPSSLSY